MSGTYKYLLLIMLIFIIPLALAQDIYRQDDIIDFKIPCYKADGNVCSSTASCNISINYPNESALISGKAMTNKGIYHNYTLTKTDILGEYKRCVNCQDGADYGHKCETFEITLTGKTSSSPVSGWVIFGIITLLFIISAALFIFGVTASPSNPQSRVVIRGIFMAGGLIFLLVTLYILNITAEEYVQMPALTSLLNRLITISGILIPAVFFFIIIAQLKMATDEIKETARGY